MTLPFSDTAPVPVVNVLLELIVTSPLRLTLPVPVVNVLLPLIVVLPLRATSPLPEVNVLSPCINISLSAAIVTSPLRAIAPVPLVNVPLPDDIDIFLSAAIVTLPLKVAVPETSKFLMFWTLLLFISRAEAALPVNVIVSSTLVEPNVILPFKNVSPSTSKEAP